MKNPKVLIVDLGSQYSLVISRTLRELGVRSVVLDPPKVESYLASNGVTAVILSGGDASVYDSTFVPPPRRILELNVPILCICLGIHWLAKEFGGAVENRPDLAQYGPTTILCDTGYVLFCDISNPEQAVYESHGDSVIVPPQGFEIVARTKGANDIQALWSNERSIAAVQFHPEVVDTKEGKALLAGFIFSVCACERDWEPDDLIDEIRDETLAALGGARAVLGFSGGVDSTTGATILAPVLKERLFGFCLDLGQFRLKELDEVRRHASAAGIQLETLIEPSRLQRAFAGTLPSGVEIAEWKRGRFSAVYGEMFTEYATTVNATCVIQLSLATDFIESGKAGASALIKSHHNTIAQFGDMKSIHPFRHLFKYEVRELAKSLELPASVVHRQPFPGPGLLVRWVGGIPNMENLNLLRLVDAKTQEVLEATDDYQKISQLVVAIPALRITGIKGDGRAYRYPVLVRPVESADFMTARGYRIPAETQEKLEHALTAYKEIVAVSYWPTSKPPETVEFE